MDKENNIKNNNLVLKSTHFKTTKFLSNALFVFWACLVLYIAAHHVFWRDEVRALSFALQGNNIFEMLQNLHGEGHPALWYIILRAANAVWNKPEVLPIVAYIVAAISFLMLVMRSQFSLLLITLILTSSFALYEYSVMARNYGVSMLILFIVAMNYHKYRNQGLVLGVLLFLLANCNAHSILLVVSFLLFWLLDCCSDQNINRKQFIKTFLANTCIAIIGIVFCLVTIYPTFNDAARSGLPDSITFKMLLRAVLLPSESFFDVVNATIVNYMLGNFSLALAPLTIIIKILSSSLLFGAALVLIKRPAALIATWSALIAFSLFFKFIYPGSYRHEVLWVIFLITMYWISLVNKKEDEFRILDSHNTFFSLETIRVLGYALLVLLMIMQSAFLRRVPTLNYDVPESRSQDLGLLIQKIPQLKDAAVIADPDYLVEALPYYLQNKTYLMREQKFGSIVRFTTKAKLILTLDDVLTNANRIKDKLHKPVIVLLSHKLNTSTSQIIKEGYNWTLTTTPSQVRSFLKSMRLLASFPQTVSDESYYVYLLI